MINWHHFKWAANFGLKYWPLTIELDQGAKEAEQHLTSSRARLSLFPMFPLIWSNSHLNSDNPYSRRRRPSEHARSWKQKSRLSKQYINVTGFRPLLFHWEAMNSKHGKRHSRHESWDVRKKQTEKTLDLTPSQQAMAKLFWSHQIINNLLRTRHFEASIFN